MKVLLIEPDHVLGTVYQAALEHAGHHTVHCRAAQVALYQAEKMRPDVVVLELQLPGHGGIEFLYEFRSYPEWQAIPVILHTMVAAKDLPAWQDQHLGIAAHHYKPATSLKQLIQAVNQAATVAL